MIRRYYELEIKIYILNSFHLSVCGEKIGNFTNYSMEKSPMLSKLHKQKGFKRYSITTPYPFDEGGLYKANKIVSYKILSNDIKIVREFEKCLEGLENDDFIVTEIIMKEWEYKNIDYLDCLTPAVITIKGTGNKNWTIDMGMEVAKEYIFNNMIKKYNSFYKLDLKISYNDVIEDIVNKSKCAIKITYKGSENILGHKFRITFKNNPIAQDLANFIVAEGIGEKNACLGCGFTKPYFRKGI